MSTITFVVPGLKKKKFSGGMWGVFEYASGLAARGHDVRIVPLLPSSPRPEWYPKYAGEFFRSNQGTRMLEALSSLVKAGASALTFNRRKAIDAVRHATYKLCLVENRFLPSFMSAGLALHYFAEQVPPTEIAVATGFHTARAVSLMQATRKFYFPQHFEPYLKNELVEPEFAEWEALQSYHLGLRLIANSSWLQRKLKEATGNDAVLCTTAVDLTVFNGSPKPADDRKQVTVISYGGRNAEWKGFSDMCAAIALARKELPDTEIVWKVYGGALLPPDNSIASYRPLGFLNHQQLAGQYRAADILLSASWYESFPLYPIEAMACGTAVITTALGTEDYAIHGQTAEIVKPRNRQDIARGLIRLIADPAYRHRIASGGHAKSQEFTWDRAISRMEQLLHE